MKTLMYNLKYAGEILNSKPLTYGQAEKQANACIYNFGYKPQILLIEDKEIFKVGDKVNYRYRGFGPSWLSGKTGKVLKINRVNIKIEVVHLNEIFQINVMPEEIWKIINHSTN